MIRLLILNVVWYFALKNKQLTWYPSLLLLIRSPGAFEPQWEHLPHRVVVRTHELMYVESTWWTVKCCAVSVTAAVSELSPE